MEPPSALPPPEAAPASSPRQGPSSLQVLPALGEGARATWPARLEETKRVRRVLEIVQLVAVQPKRWLRRDLAERFELSERQIDKDLQLIRHGLLLSLRHSAGGYFFEQLPSLAAAPLRFEEALALLLAVQAARQTAGVDSADLEAAILRLEAQFPVPVRDLLLRATTELPPDERARHRTEVLGTIERALADGCKLRMAYASAARGGEIVERKVRPYALLPYVRSWHLVGYCELREDVRMFKADRIRALSLTDEPCAVPPDFDLDAYRGGGWGLLRMGDQPAERVELLFDAQAGRWVSEEHWHPRQQVTHLPDGRVRFEVEVPISPELVRWVLGYGPRVRVLAPAALRAAVVGEARGVVEGGEEEEAIEPAIRGRVPSG